MERNDSLSRAIKLAGSQAKLAEQIGHSQQKISYWLTERAGVVPAEAAVAIEAVTGISRQDLRPDLFAEPAE